MTITNAPQPTTDLGQGLSNLERFGYTIHPGWLDARHGTHGTKSSVE